MSLKKLFLPVGLVLSIIVALVLPWPGVFVGTLGAKPISIVIIFLINGYNIKVSDLKFNKKTFLAFGAACAISLLVSPFIGVGVAWLMGLQGAFALGLIVMSSMPPTLSSGIVITGVSGGNSVLALALTVMLNLVAVFIIPFTLKFSLSGQESIEISSIPMLLKLLGYVFIPFLIGYVIKRIKSLPNVSGYLTYVPSLCVISVVWCSLSKTRDQVMAMSFNILLISLVAVVVAHLIFLIVSALFSRYFIRMNASDSKAFSFVVGQKTLPIALSVLAALNIDASGPIMVCILFHFCQLIVDSFIAARVAGNDVSRLEVSTT